MSGLYHGRLKAGFLFIRHGWDVDDSFGSGPMKSDPWTRPGAVSGKWNCLGENILFGLARERVLCFKPMILGRQGSNAIHLEPSREDLEQVIRKNGDLVYATALRCLNGNANEACDLAQSVFVDFHRKRDQLSAKTVVSGWLYQHTRFLAARFIRAEERRRRREREAMRRQVIEAGSNDLWDSIRPVLDEAIDHLKGPDRDVVVLRFLRGLSLRETGLVLGISEDAARMRASRALDRLRVVLEAFGIRSTSGALSSSLVLASLSVAPAGFGQATVLAVGAVGGLQVGGWMMKGLTMTKAKAAIAGLSLLVGVGVPWYVKTSLENQRALQVRELAALTEEITELKESEKRLKDSESALRDQVEKFGAERSELFKLRGQVRRLRTENDRLREEQEALGTEESIAESPKEGPIKTFYGEWNAELKSGESIVTGGWPIEDGRWGFLVVRAEVVEGANDGQVIVKSGILKGTEAVAQALNLGNLGEGQIAGSSSGVLDSEVLDAYLELERQDEAIQYLGSPVVTTMSGRQASISTGNNLELDGEMHRVGTTVNVIPEILEDGSTVRVALSSEWSLPNSPEAIAPEDSPSEP